MQVVEKLQTTQTAIRHERKPKGNQGEVVPAPTSTQCVDHTSTMTALVKEFHAGADRFNAMLAARRAPHQNEPMVATEHAALRYQGTAVEVECNRAILRQRSNWYLDVGFRGGPRSCT